MSVPAALPTVFLWASIIFGALAFALLAWIIHGVITDRRAGREIDTDTRWHARQEAERIAARDAEAFTTRRVDYPTAVLPGPAPLPHSPVIDGYLASRPHPTYEPRHHGLWPTEPIQPPPLRPLPPDLTHDPLNRPPRQHGKVIVNPETTPLFDELVRDAAADGIRVQVIGLPLATRVWGVRDRRGGHYCARDRAQKAITP